MDGWMDDHNKDYKVHSLWRLFALSVGT